MDDFTSASRRALKFLHDNFGLDLWMVTRVENDNWIVLSAEDHAYGVGEGTVLKWSESFCARMVAGEGPNFAHDSGLVPAYRDARIGQRLAIGSYVGIPLKQPDGSLFGTLCAISPKTQPPEMEARMGVIRIIGDLLSCLLSAELKADATQRRLERAVDNARTDYLTALYNRRGWAEFMQREEDRCRRYGHPACVFSIDLDDLKVINDREGHARGDEHLRAAAAAIQSAVRSSDIVARVGGDEFVALCVECDAAEASRVSERLRAAFSAARISASIGMAPRGAEGGIEGAAAAADAAMYEEKRRKKSGSAGRARNRAVSGGSDAERLPRVV